MSAKKVLEEHEYVDVLEHIIERDFFPDLSSLRNESATLSHGNTTVLRSSARKETGETLLVSNGIPSSKRDSSSSWDLPTPIHRPMEPDFTQHEHTQDKRIVTNEEDCSGIEKMTLNRFVATHTSEDNAAFTELQNKAKLDHKEKYYWAYEHGERGDPKFHLLTNGTWISKEQRKRVDEILAPNNSQDDRPNQVETWPHRVRNTLLFAPDLETTKSICRVQNKDALLSLENGSVISMSDKNRRLGRPPRGKCETVYANSRFSTRNESTKLSVATNSDYSNTPVSEYRLLQMTPNIAPGIDASPLMTWGDIEGTPMILDGRDSTVQIPASASLFNIKETTIREKVADRLESEVRRRKTQRHQRKNGEAISPRLGLSSTPSPISSRKRVRSGEKPTPMSERAYKLRMRLSGLRNTSRTPVVSSDAELRASYLTPLRAPSKHARDGGSR